MVDFAAPAVIVGGIAFSYGEVALGAAAFLLALLVGLAVLVWRSGASGRVLAEEARLRQQELETRLGEMARAHSELTGRLKSMAELSASRQSQLARTLNERLDQVSHRLGQNLESNSQRTSETLTRLNERLAVIDTAQKNITELSSQVVTLQDILANKQARGAFGQGRMEAIITDGLPRGAYEFQPTLSNGTRPDCLIRLPNAQGGVVIDAKFPLEAINALREAGSAKARREATQRVRTDLMKHVSDIASKYLIPGETQETAIMFVPSESIYAELYESFEDVIQKAHRARVVIVSPNMLMLAVQTMQAIFKDARMREQAHLIQAEVSRMIADVHRLRERVLDLQKHFGLAGKDIEKILISSDKVSRRGLRIEQLDLEPPEEDTAKALGGAAGAAGAGNEPAASAGSAAGEEAAAGSGTGETAEEEDGPASRRPRLTARG